MGVVANTIDLHRNAAVGFIDWLGLLMLLFRPFHLAGLAVISCAILKDDPKRLILQLA